MPEQAGFDLVEFRKAADVVREMNGHNAHLDFSPVLNVSKQLEKLTPSLEEFLEVDVVVRCHLRAGATRVGKKFAQDEKLFHFLKGMLGNTRKIQRLDELHLSQTQVFLEGVAGTT